MQHTQQLPEMQSWYPDTSLAPCHRLLYSTECCQYLAGMASPKASDCKDHATTNFPKRYWLDIVVLGGMVLATWFLIQFF